MAVPTIKREAFSTSRELDFLSQKELTAQMGHFTPSWPLCVVKEAIDNGLDACEEAGITPEIHVAIETHQITVTDNGPGIPHDVIKAATDFSRKVSSREAYVAPDRGQQGNALQTLFAIPRALDLDGQSVTIRSRGSRHEIAVSVDRISQRPVVAHQRFEDGFANNGTSITVPLACSPTANPDQDLQEPCPGRSLIADARSRLVEFIHNFGFLNPHLTLRCDWEGDQVAQLAATDTSWRKWTPCRATSAHWYAPSDFERLVTAYIASDREHGIERPIREFLALFSGLRGTRKQKAVTDTTGLSRAHLSSLVTGDEHALDRGQLSALLTAMQEHSKPIKPQAIGVIRRSHWESRLAALGCQKETMKYKARFVPTANSPSVLEVAFAWCPGIEERRIITGVNWSPSIGNPFRVLGPYRQNLDSFLSEQRVSRNDPVVLLIHLATPRPRFTDRGKAAIALGVRDQVSEEIIKATTAVTKAWSNQRKREERDASAEANRERTLVRSKSATVKQLAMEVIEEAYLIASDNGDLPAYVRQIMYAARGLIQTRTNEMLNDQYFIQTILPEYLRSYDPAWRENVVTDARGHFWEPHTGKTFGVGTLEVRSYLGGQPDSGNGQWIPPALYPTHGATNRFAAVLFVEKEGFIPLFEKVQLANRYDLAILSTKGQHVVAARRLVDEICARQEIPLLVLHDFDKAGFSMVGTFRRDSARYRYQHRIKVIDLGIRLNDVQSWSIQDEAFYTKQESTAMARNLRANGATQEEIDMIAIGKRRVELNALPADQLVDFIQSKLNEHQIAKVVPDTKTLRKALKCAYKHCFVANKLEQVDLEFEEFLDEPQVKGSLRIDGLPAKVASKLQKQPAKSWDQSVSEIAAETFSQLDYEID